MALVVLSVVEQRLDAVRAVLDGAEVTEVTARMGVHRSTVHRWVAKYLTGQIAGAQGRAVIVERYRVSDDLRARRRTSHAKTGTSRRHQESPDAPTPARPRTTLRRPAEPLDTA